MDVRVVLVDPDPMFEEVLAERERLGLDARDERWEGVLHVVPPAQTRQQDIGGMLFEHLAPVARDHDLVLRYEIGVFRPGTTDDHDYRIPDLAAFGDGVRSRRGVEGAAAAVVEIRSPGDESYDKIGFYLDVGVGEVLIIDRDTLTPELFRERGADGAPVRAGDTTLRSLDVTLQRITDDHLHLTWPDGEADVRL